MKNGSLLFAVLAVVVLVPAAFAGDVPAPSPAPAAVEETPPAEGSAYEVFGVTDLTDIQCSEADVPEGVFEIDPLHGAEPREHCRWVFHACGCGTPARVILGNTCSGATRCTGLTC